MPDPPPQSNRPAKRTAFDCLRRGFLSSRANWGLVPLGILQNLLFTLLALLSLLPPFLVLGGMALLERDWSGPGFEEWLAGLDDLVASALVPLALAVVASLLIGLLAVAVWGWFQGGILGVLLAAERQALPGAEARPGGWRWFRTLSLRDFAGWGGRYVWRFFWFFHLSLAVAGVLVLLIGLLILGAVMAQEAWGGGAALGIGCGGALPLLFGLVVYALWNGTAQPAVALDGSGALRGAALGLRIVGRRLGATLLVGLVVLVLSFGVGLAFSMGQLSLDVLLRDRFALWLAAYGLASLVQGFLSVALTIFGLASFTSLVTAEAAEEAR